MLVTLHPGTDAWLHSVTLGYTWLHSILHGCLLHSILARMLGYTRLHSILTRMLVTLHPDTEGVGRQRRACHAEAKRRVAAKAGGGRQSCSRPAIQMQKGPPALRTLCAHSPLHAAACLCYLHMVLATAGAATLLRKCVRLPALCSPYCRCLCVCVSVRVGVWVWVWV